MNRRTLLRATAALSALKPLTSAQSKQTFTAGIVPAGTPSVEGYWTMCDECSRLGVRHIEVNNTFRKIVETYESRIPEFRDEMARRNLTLVGCAMYSHMHIAELQNELIESHLRVARFLKATGGKYMDPLVAPGENLRNGADEEYRKVDVKTAAANANEIGKRVREETGITIGLHPEQGDIRSGFVDPFMDATDPRYFNLWADVGHFVACGVDPMGVYKKYRTRLIGTHLRDYQPPAPAGAAGARGRMVPFGQGIIKLQELVAYLRDTAFTGHVMGEGGGNQPMRDYMTNVLRLQL
jgi:sugar phosphate isomerase/epimerase